MRILAFDCAGAQCSAALAIDSEAVLVENIPAERGHAQILLPLLQKMLAEAGLGFDDIDRFAVTTGPGSFTGIRVALAGARGLALGTGKPVIGVTVFETLAAQALRRGIAAPRLLIAIESRRDALFVQWFDAAGRSLTDPQMLSPAEAGAGAGPEPEPVALAGDAAWRVAPHVRQIAADAIIPGAWIASVDPAILAILAAERPAGASPAPFYIRAADAQPNPAR